MSLPLQRRTADLANPMTDILSRAEAKALASRQNAEVMRGLIAATRIQAKGFATLVATELVGSLSREASFQNRGDPKDVARTDLLIDQLTLSAAREIGRI